LDSIHKGDVGIKDIVNQSPIFGKINRNYGIIE
jgi:hypothetical protein